MLIATLKPEDRDHYRMPKVYGDGWAMIAPECFAVDCTNGRVRFTVVGLCETCEARSRMGGVQIKPRWLQAHPERWKALADLLGR